MLRHLTKHGYVILKQAAEVTKGSDILITKTKTKMFNFSKKLKPKLKLE